MIQKDLSTSSDSFEFDDNVFDVDPICNDHDNQSQMADNYLYLSANVNDNHYHLLRSKSDSETLHNKSRLSKFQSLNEIPEFFDLPDNYTVHDSPTLLCDQSKCSLYSNQSQASNRNTRTKYDLRPLTKKIYRLFIPPSSSINNPFHDS